MTTTIKEALDTILALLAEGLLNLKGGVVASNPTTPNSTTSAILCDHANESGNNCNCKANCYCKVHSCQPGREG